MIPNERHVKQLEAILADFVEKCPQVNLAAKGAQQELAKKIAVEWGSWRGAMRKRTEDLITSYERELEAKLQQMEDGDEVHVTR